MTIQSILYSINDHEPTNHHWVRRLYRLRNRFIPWFLYS